MPDPIPGEPLFPRASPAPLASPLPIDPTVRRMLIEMGARFSLMMAARNKMPEQLARDIGQSIELVNQVRLGAEPDIGIRALAAMCTALGCALQIGVAQAEPPAPPPLPG